MKYKHAESEGWYYTIDDQGNKGQSWNKKNRPVMFKEMQEWEAAGNKIEPQFTAEELAERESEEAEKAKTAYIGLRKSEYPDPMEYNDSLVKQMSEDETVRSEGLAQRDKYFYDCQAVKDKYPKP